MSLLGEGWRRPRRRSFEGGALHWLRAQAASIWDSAGVQPAETKHCWRDSERASGWAESGRLEKQALSEPSSPQDAATASSRLRVWKHWRGVADVRVAEARMSEVRMESRILELRPRIVTVVLSCNLGCPGLLCRYTCICRMAFPIC